MPQPVTDKENATPAKSLAYLEALAQTMIGLQSANRDLIARRGHADSNETRTIDVQLSYNAADWSRVSAAQILFYTQNISFNPPTASELAKMRSIVHFLDGVIAAQTRADAVIAETNKLVAIFRSTQALQL